MKTYKPVVASSRLVLQFLLIAVAVALAACAGPDSAVTPISVQVTPATASVQTGQAQRFTATVTNTSNTAVTWQVNNVTGGNSTAGTISATGLFTAPTTVPASNPVTVNAISVADNTKSDTASVTITPAPNVSVTIAPK